MHPRTVLQAAAAGAILLVVTSCSDQTDPSNLDSSMPDAALSRQGSPDDPNALARAVPGFGGFYLDATGAPTIYLKEAGRRPDAERALAPYLRKHGLGAGQLKIKKADFDWAQLESWFGSASAEALAVPGAVFVDADEASNRVRIAVEPGATGRVRAALAKLRLPDGALIVEERAPITYAVGVAPGPRPKAKPGSGASLQGVWRPTVGGVQINFPGFLCTLGFNVGGSFVTNSHCTTTQGGVENTPYWQPTQTSQPTQIAREAVDPAYATGGTCPSGRRCRRSDSSRATYINNTPNSVGRIAKTSRPGRSLTTAGQFSITAEGSAIVGQVVNKVGRTTGWSQGAVTQTCANINVSGSNVTQLCQNVVSATVGSGDSGSPVFRITSGDNVTLVGILWGGSGSNLFIYSPLDQVKADVGSFNATVP